jgi:phosphoribosylglycinamide formyltransferase-1
MPANYRLALFASGSGTNAEEIFRHFKNHPTIHPVLLLSNNPDAYALTRATNHGIEALVFSRQEFSDGTVLAHLQKANVTHLILAGFLWLMPGSILKSFEGKVVNIHPALLPAFGGKGMYGMRVHQAVKESGAPETGITIHEVNERYDEGKVIFQAKCAISPEDTPEIIAKKVHELEYRYFSQVIESWIENIPLKTV